jgi:hypothetical protein
MSIDIDVNSSETSREKMNAALSSSVSCWMARLGRMMSLGIPRLSLTLRESKKVKKTCDENVSLLKPSEANLYLVNARAFTQGEEKPKMGGKNGIAPS